jgi:diadenylate cyclase
MSQWLPDWSLLLKYISPGAVADVFLIGYLIYRLLLVARGTRALQVMGGLIVFFAMVLATDWLNLYALNWLLKEALVLGPVALVVLFLPELRHALEEFGRPGFWGRGLVHSSTADVSQAIDEVVAAVSVMSVKRIGALIVFERESQVEDIVATGTLMDAVASASLLDTIFYKGTPLHDGAVVVRHGKVLAAGCTLPLTDSPRVDATVHTRHKAALGMSEASDAIVVVVSEETGIVSIAADGKLLRPFREDTLRERLQAFLKVQDARTAARERIGQVANRVGGAIMKRNREREQGQ